MNFGQYQKLAHVYAKYPAPNKYEYPIHALAEEAGEVSGVRAKYLRLDYGVEIYQEKLRKELGDVLWQLSEICTVHGFELSEIAQENLQKLEDRKNRNVLKGSGDDR